MIIGRPARNVSVEAALDHVFGYSCLNDVSARDLQFGDGQWVRGKSLDTFCPIGPWIVTADEIPDPQALAIRCRVGNETLQDGSTGDMIFGVAELVSRLSRAFTLEPGDVIATGTPPGIGWAREPSACSATVRWWRSRSRVSASSRIAPWSMPERWDVVVVGSGNAGFSAALTAAGSGASVLVIDAGPEEWIGGNSAFTAGAFRTTYGSLDDLRPVLRVDDATAASIDLAPYTADDFRDDIQSMAGGRSDPDLVDVLVGEAADAVRWLADRGVGWELLEARQSFLVDGRRRFWGNLTVGIAGGGVGLIEAEAVAARGAGVMLRFDTRLVELELSEGRVVGVVVAGPDGRERIEAGAVVLASGGFEADASRRAAYLGPGWDLAKVRGTPYDTGDPMFLAIAAGAATAGHWSGCHAIAWDAAAPPFGDRVLTNRFSRQSYPFGLVVDRDGRRFVDEGADFRNYTYARYGAEILRRPVHSRSICSTPPPRPSSATWTTRPRSMVGPGSKQLRSRNSRTVRGSIAPACAAPSLSSTPGSWIPHSTPRSKTARGPWVSSRRSRTGRNASTRHRS